MGLVTTWLGDNWLLILLVLAVIAAFLVFRSSPTQVSNLAEFKALVSSGRPAVVEFYSNY